MKVVRQKSTQRLVYRESPDFVAGKGILNASAITRVPISDLEEIDALDTDWTTELALRQSDMKEIALNNPIISALIMAIEDKFPMLRGQLRQMVKDRMP